MRREETQKRRTYWVAELSNLDGSFSDASIRMIAELRTEIANEGEDALLDHLRLCGTMPEQYKRDSSEEKLYSKYTDAVISESLSAIGLNSALIDTRADAADVQARGRFYSLVADAKASRLSRTAKNQKDFKIQAMDGWRDGLDYAVVVCPIYHLPTRTSQIYQQAIVRNVCILSYSHLAALVGLAIRQGALVAEVGFQTMVESVSVLHPSKNAVDYWTGVNRALVDALGQDPDLWTSEKSASIEAFQIVKEESLLYLRTERNRLLGFSHQEALNELIRLAGIDSGIAHVEGIKHGELLEA